MIDEIWREYIAGDFSASFDCNTRMIHECGGLDLMHVAGLSLLQTDRIDDGLQLLKTAIAFRPSSPQLYQNAALIAQQKGLLDAVDHFTEAGLRDFPHDDMLNGLKGNNFLQRGEIDQAIAHYQRRVFHDLSDIKAKINLALSYSAASQFAQAELYFDAAAWLNPQHRDLVLGRAAMYGKIRRIDDAIALLEAFEDDVDARFMLAVFHLDKGDYLRGWQLHADRWDAVSFQAAERPLRQFRSLDQVDGKRIAVLREGGWGDLFMMLRYLPMLAGLAGEVLLHAGPADRRLLAANLPSNVSLMDYDPKAHFVPLPKSFELTTALLDLPYHFKTTIETIPNALPYIRVPEAAIAARRLPPTEKRRVGLTWAGGAAEGLFKRAYDERRSIALPHLARLAEIAGIEFINLQSGAHAQDAGLAMTCVLTEQTDWLDTAAIIAQLDLVITVDTAVAHLAGAMGAPTWLLSRYDACWRWRCNGQDSDQWYPGVRIFSQTAFGDWTQAIAALRVALESWTANPLSGANHSRDNGRREPSEGSPLAQPLRRIV